MNKFDKIKQMDVDEFARWLDRHTNSDDSDWLKWWDNKYCKNCEPEFAYSTFWNDYGECSYCENYGNCRFFPELSESPDLEQIIKMWLEREEDDN